MIRADIFWPTLYGANGKTVMSADKNQLGKMAGLLSARNDAVRPTLFIILWD